MLVKSTTTRLQLKKTVRFFFLRYKRDKTTVEANNKNNMKTYYPKDCISK